MLANRKNKARLIILTAFVLGVLTGVGGMNLIAARFAPAAGAHPNMLEEIAREVSLTPAQRAEVDSILKKTRAESQEILKPLQPQMLDLRARTRAQIRAVLSPEQQARYDEWTRKRDAVKDAHDKQAAPTPTAK